MNELELKIRKHDYDRFICSLFAPEEQRQALLSLYAFNLEIAKIREITKEEMIGLIRLQWWRDAIEEIYAGKYRSHEVVDIIAETIKKFTLPKDLFLKIIDGRERDLAIVPFKDISEIENYAAEVSSPLFILASIIVGVRTDGAKNLGEAWALTGMLRAMAHNVATNKPFIEYDAGLIKNIANRAKELNNKFIEDSKKLSPADRKKLKPILALSAYINTYLKRIKKIDYKILENDIENPKFTMQLKAWLFT